MALTSDQINALYQSEFGRPADAAGLQYWQSSGLDASAMKGAFDSSAEYSQVHPSTAAAPQNLDATKPYTPSAGYDPVAAAKATASGPTAYAQNGYDVMLKMNPAMAAAIPREVWDAGNKALYETPMSRGQIENFVTSIYNRPVTEQDFTTYAGMTPWQMQNGVFSDASYVSPYTQKAANYDNAMNTYSPTGVAAAQGASQVSGGVQMIPGAAGWNPATANDPAYKALLAGSTAQTNANIAGLGGYGGSIQERIAQQQKAATMQDALPFSQFSTPSPFSPRATQPAPTPTARTSAADNQGALTQIASSLASPGMLNTPGTVKPIDAGTGGGPGVPPGQGTPAAWSRDAYDQQSGRSNVKFRRGGRT